jgi:Icc-related predicted phosphoesterase
MKLIIISDTHGEQEKLGTLSGDVLIHCGDMFNMFGSDDDDFDRMDAWFGKQQFDLIVCVGGNHDFELEKRSLYTDKPFKNAVYLEGTSLEYQGLIIHGAPWVPELRGQAFFKEESELRNCWSAIPKGVDILITHTPPAGILDVSSGGLKLGCEHLSAELKAKAPSLHCFGHVHASSGVHVAGKTTYINAAQVNSHFKISREPYEHML